MAPVGIVNNSNRFATVLVINGNRVSKELHFKGESGDTGNQEWW